jgi:hypothetical protein
MYRYQDIIFIDFEGFKGKPPSMVGIWEQYHRDHKPHFRTLILDPQLKGLASMENPRVDYQSLNVFMNRISKRARRENKKIIAYSNHELLKFGENGIDISDCYVNARAETSRWFSINQKSNRPKPLGLKPVLKYLNYPALIDYGTQRVTEKIKRIKNQLILHKQDPTKLTPLAQENWRDLVAYNEQDVRGLVYVLEEIGLLKP